MEGANTRSNKLLRLWSFLNFFHDFINRTLSSTKTREPMLMKKLTMSGLNKTCNPQILCKAREYKDYSFKFFIRNVPPQYVSARISMKLPWKLAWHQPRSKTIRRSYISILTTFNRNNPWHYNVMKIKVIGLKESTSS